MRRIGPLIGPIRHLARVYETPRRPGRYGLGHMRRSALCLVQLLLSLTALHAASLAWVRILAGDADPVVWTPGARWPARPALFPFAPSAVLSYATVCPGDELADSRLEARASRWERALVISGRFSLARVYVVELEGAGAEGGPRRGLIVEAEPVDAPCFDGGAAYASVELPLFRGFRESVLVDAGVNRAELAYRDDTLGDAPFVLASSLRYDNDLLQTGCISGNRLSGSLALGPRLSSYGDLLGGCRIEAPLPAPLAGGESDLVAADLTLELIFPELLGLRALTRISRRPAAPTSAPPRYAYSPDRSCGLIAIPSISRPRRAWGSRAKASTFGISSLPAPRASISWAATASGTRRERPPPSASTATSRLCAGPSAPGSPRPSAPSSPRRARCSTQAPSQA